MITRYGIAVVTTEKVAVVRMTQGGVRVFRAGEKGAVEQALAKWNPAPGAYRIRLFGDFVRGFYLTARPCNLTREVAKLEASGAGKTVARTGSPGISFYGGRSYQRCETMAQAAADNRRQESRYMAEELRKLTQ